MLDTATGAGACITAQPPPQLLIWRELEAAAKVLGMLVHLCLSLILPAPC